MRSFGSEDRPLAKKSLASALALEPQLLDGQEPLLSILSDYTYPSPVQASAAFSKSSPAGNFHSRPRSCPIVNSSADAWLPG